MLTIQGIELVVAEDGVVDLLVGQLVQLFRNLRNCHVGFNHLADTIPVQLHNLIGLVFVGGL